MSGVVVMDYDQEWPNRAANLITVLEEALCPVQRVEHIGSTAIPNMAAKDVIDLQASVGDLELAATAFDGPLENLGFHRSSYDRDHLPAGHSAQFELWEKRLWTRREHPQGDVNLHVRVTGSPNERFALLFRDWFRVHPEAVPAYSAFKRSLAAIAGNIGTYTDIKDPVVDMVIALAEPWATSVGWNSAGNDR
jgi:GrpB-like predicted nucleotidyltransferase (UPF0157 family)